VTDLEVIPSDRNPGQWLCERYRSKVEDALGYTQIRQPKLPLVFETFASSVANDLLRQRAAGKPQLWDAFQSDPHAALGALLHAAACKLLPGTAFGRFWLIPYRDKGRPTVRGQVGYKGLAEMAMRNPRVHSCEAHLVYKGERFSYNAGTGKIDHEVDLLGDRSFENCIGGYFKGIITTEATMLPVLDAPIIVPLSIAEILKRRDTSESWKRSGKSSVWGQWPAEMARKTLIANGLNHGSMPSDPGIAQAIEKDTESDAAQDDVTPRGKPASRAQDARRALGIELGSLGTTEQFAFAEDAVAFVEQATADQIHSESIRWAHFAGFDAEIIAEAIARRMEELGDG
jgi:phage RecT family recombinase